MSKRIMVVDDSRFIWEEIRRCVKDTEFEVCGCAKNGEDALELYSQLNPDIVTMDIILPGMDGLETSRLVKEQWPDAKIIVLSSLAYDETIREAGSLGVCGFLFKPFDIASLLKALRAAVQ